MKGKSQSKKEPAVQAIGIGASIGGPAAIAEILGEMPNTLPIPIFIVQHIIPEFTEDFIRWLQGQTKLIVRPAKDGEIAKAGTVYIPVKGCQIEIKRGGLLSLKNIPNQPSIDCLFKSLAETYASHCIGVILTGMGNDGAEGLFAMKLKGALTIAQDEESCIVFGMPKEAILLGAASQVLPLNKIAAVLKEQIEGT
jgi:two-component system chemotaxis response regulator CheB